MATHETSIISLGDSDKDELMKRFPSIELCYESNIEHNKVSAHPDYYSLIPKGKKLLLWTTYFKQYNKISFALELNRGNIENIRHVHIPNDKSHAYGSILYGTAFSKNCFCIENIHYYKGRNVEKATSKEQLELCKDYMKLCYSDIHKSMHWSFTMGIPYMCVDMDECVRMQNLVPYRVFSIQHKKFHWNNKKIHFSFVKNSVPVPTHNNVSFIVMADVQNDVYHAYYNDNDESYSTLYIPDIKTSTMMNKLFRNIKENDNLDALEESDDEDDFENINENKYVLENRKYVIDCAYNAKFKKWYPVKLSKNKHCETSLQDVKKYENNANGFEQRPNVVGAKTYAKASGYGAKAYAKTNGYGAKAYAKTNSYGAKTNTYAKTNSYGTVGNNKYNTARQKKYNY